jgi:ABC-2 type transport system ATP-binding protein
MKSKVLSVEFLSKSFGNIEAVKNVSFYVEKGEIVGLLGPNGAGKTTTINMVLGLLEPTLGNVKIEESDLVKNRSLALAKTNFAAVYAPLPGNLTVYQNLRIFSLIYEVKNASQRIEELITQFELSRFRDSKCGVLSSGEQTRVCLAKAMLNQPKLLVLDEPTASLDPSTAKEIRTKIREFANTGESGVLWTSHNMYEVEDVCDRVLFLSKGKILLGGNPKTLPAEYGKPSLEELFIAVAREPVSLQGV